jgi:hypothetical protein
MARLARHIPYLLPKMSPQNTAKVFRLFFIHNVAMTLLILLTQQTGALSITSQIFWIIAWAYWIVGVVLIYVYAKSLGESKLIRQAGTSSNE